MKKLSYIAVLILTAFSLASCGREVVPSPSEGGEPGVWLKASIIGSTPQGLSGSTRAKGDGDSSIKKDDEVAAMDALRENYIGTLDIFVKESGAADDAAWFKEYHLVAASEAGFTNGEQIKLHDNWTSSGYDREASYDIYVCANNPHTQEGSAPASLAELLALSTTDSELFKYYYSGSSGETAPYGLGHMDNYPATHEKAGKKKEFRMDCAIKGWSIDPNSARQVFDAQLQRDAAKIVIRVHYGSQANIPLVTEDGSTHETDPATGKIKHGSLKEYLSYIGRTEVGAPRWKYNNFSFTDGDIADAGLDAGSGLDSYESSLALNRDDANPTDASLENLEDWHYTLVTYSAPFSWGSNTEKTPFVLYSVAFTIPASGAGTEADRKLYYYRLPVCDERVVKGLERNHIYIVDVSICSLGSENETFKWDDSELRIEYHVIPWTEHDVAQNATTTVIASDTQYLSVSPQQYTLKGDGRQSVTIGYYASLSTPDGRFIDIVERTSSSESVYSPVVNGTTVNETYELTVTYKNYKGNTLSITGTPVKQVWNGSQYVTATDANTTGNTNIRFVSTAPAAQSDGTPNATYGTKGEQVIITITPSGDITIESDALSNKSEKTITFTATLLTAGLTKKVIIKHSSVESIKHITGAYATRSTDGWISWDMSQALPTSANYTANSGKQAYTGTAPTYRNLRALYQTISTTNTNRDFKNWTFSSTEYIWRAEIYVENKTTPANSVIRYFEAADNWKYAGSTSNNNPQMYVIQNTSTSSKFSLGYATIDENYQSYDHVVSPAFMIASQLGATVGLYLSKGTTSKPTTAYWEYAYYDETNDRYYRNLTDGTQNGTQYYSLGKLAAYHCGTYREVGTIDGTNYKEFDGWRLPTREEIGIIMKYQSENDTHNISIADVLTGKYYWTLENKAVASGYNIDGGQEYSQKSENDFTGDDCTYANIRCVRDLTLEELNALNQ